MLHRLTGLNKLGAILFALAWWCSASRATPAARSPVPVEIEIPIRAGGFGMAFYEETARQFEKVRPGTKVSAVA